MAKLLKLRRGTTTQHASFTGAEGEVTVDVTKDTAVVHDGSQAGGRPLAREDMSNVSSASIAGQLGTDSIAVTKIAAGALPTDVTVASANIVDGTIVSADIANGTIVDEDVSGTAAIAGSKIHPNFGSQNIETTGDLTAGEGNFIKSSNDTTFADASAPATIHGVFTNNSQSTNGVFSAFTATANNASGTNQGASFIAQSVSGGTCPNVFITQRTASNVQTTGLSIDTSQNVAIPNGNLNVTGNIGVTGTVDGRDVAADGTKLDTYQANGSSYVRSDASDFLTGSTYTLNSSTDQKLVLKGANNPFIMLQEGTVDKAYIQWNAGGYLDIVNNEAGEHLKISTGENGLIWRANSADYTVWHSGNDGAGSGLDADTLDGVTSNSFLRSDTSDSASGDITFSGGTGAVNVAAASDIRMVGGGWTGDNYGSGIKIQPTSTSSYFCYHGNLYFRQGTGGNNRITIDSSGNLTAAGNVTAYSDARLKTDISTINDALGICGKLRGVSYKWIADGKPSIGVIAQEVEEVIPEVVLTNVDTDPETGETTEVKSVDYGKIVGVLINAINELKAEVDELKGGK